MFLNFCVHCRHSIPAGTGRVHEGRQLCDACHQAQQEQEQEAINDELIERYDMWVNR